MRRHAPLSSARVSAAALLIGTIALGGCSASVTESTPSTSHTFQRVDGKCYDVSFWGIPLEVPCHTARMEVTDTRLFVGDTFSVNAFTYAGDTVSVVSLSPAAVLVDSRTGPDSFWDGTAIGPAGSKTLLKTRQRYHAAVPGRATLAATGPDGTTVTASVQVVTESEVKSVSLSCPDLGPQSTAGFWARLRVVDRSDSLVSTVRTTRWTISDTTVVKLGNTGWYPASSAGVFLIGRKSGTATLTGQVGSLSATCTAVVP